MKKGIRFILSLLPEYIEEHMPKFSSISEPDVTDGLFSYIVADAASSYSIQYLLFLINSLEKLCEKIN